MAACFSRFGSALSHGMCSDTVGVARVSWLMTAQSSSLSKMSRGSPGPGKRAKRVPPVPTPQDGTATWNAATLSRMASMAMPRRAELLAEMRRSRRRARPRARALSAATMSAEIMVAWSGHVVALPPCGSAVVRRARLTA